MRSLSVVQVKPKRGIVEMMSEINTIIVACVAPTMCQLPSQSKPFQSFLMDQIHFIMHPLLLRQNMTPETIFYVNLCINRNLISFQVILNMHLSHQHNAVKLLS